MSTEPAVYNGIGRRDGSRYTVAPPVRVRNEAFGLLFYNTEESRLTFVKSGNLLRIQTLPDGAKSITAEMKPETRAKAKKVLEHLLKKGLICES